VKIFKVQQIREWDAYTIGHEPIASIDLMERAATLCFDKIQLEFDFEKFAVLCGPGNNGGDGLVIARKLIEDGKMVNVFIPEITSIFSDDFKINLNRFPKESIIYFKEDNIPDFNNFDCLVDALFGSGLNRKLDGFLAHLVSAVNSSDCYIISIDIPSGLFADIDQLPFPDVFIRAEKTYSLQIMKSALFNEEIRADLGDVEVVNIGLSDEFYKKNDTNLNAITRSDLFFKEDSDYTHKFEQGFALIVGGSKGKYGAPILSAKAAMRSGAGLVSMAIPNNGRDIAHSSMNELMVVDCIGHNLLEKIEIPEKVKAIGIGPGFGMYEKSILVLANVLKHKDVGMVIDADALNLLAEYEELKSIIPESAILTPHKGEFERLFGSYNNVNDKHKLLVQNAIKFKVIIVLKGAITTISDSQGNLYFSDAVGNKGMATAGSGDVLTGIITSLLAQGYSPLQAAINGVYLHGYAGDLHLVEENYRSLVASDIINNLGKALKNLTE
jgi:NAD(P)H-hydrate epimerase